MSEFQKDELSLDETNRLRVKLGLNPLLPDSDDEGEKSEAVASTVAAAGQGGVDEDSDPLRNQEEKAARNYAAHQEAAKRKREEDEVAERIARARNRRDLNRRLQGPTLGDAGPSEAKAKGDGSDAKSWLKAQRKRAKELAAKRQKEEAEAEAAVLANAPTYEGKDLRGLRVGHDIDNFELEEGGEERILTLRDSRILDEGDDELMDTALDEAERDKRNEERKKGPKKYTGLDDAEFASGRVGEKRSILSKYDDDIDGGIGDRDADAGFVLGGEAKTRTLAEAHARQESVRRLNRSMLDLDYAKNEAISDYLQEGDIGFKKPKAGKKKKRQATTRIRLDEEERDESQTVATNNGDAMQVDGVVNGRVILSTSDLVDDDDLARSLATARRKQAKRTYQKMTPEMIAQNLAAQRAAEAAEEAEKATAQRASPADVSEDVKPDEVGLVFDETSEFVRNIQQAQASASAQLLELPTTTIIKTDGDVGSVPHIRRGGGNDSMDATAMLEAKPDPDLSDGEGEDDEMHRDAKEDADEKQSATTLTAAEPLVSGGLASTLSLLRNQGLVAQITPEQRERELQQRKNDLWLAQRRSEDSVREAELALSKAQGSAKDQAQREYENRVREMDDAKLAQERFKDYRPDIDIKYHDEFGRELNNHEAWKRLSHVFHGKAPGKKKQEKRLQRIEDEKRREKMLSGDTPTGMSKAFSDRAERSGQAHMVIGVGSRNNAPQDVEFLQPSMKRLEKGGKDGVRGSGWRDRIVESEIAPAVGGDARSDGQNSTMVGITSMVPRSTLPKSRAGFVPVKRASHLSSVAPNGDQSLSTATAPPSKFKLAFGKRPASDTSNGPSTKQRKIE